LNQIACRLRFCPKPISIAEYFNLTKKKGGTEMADYNEKNQEQQQAGDRGQKDQQQEASGRNPDGGKSTGQQGGEKQGGYSSGEKGDKEETRR